MKHIYTSLDIGSDSIKIAVCELYQNKLNLLAATSCKSKGIKRGLITDVDLAAACINKAFLDIYDITQLCELQLICHNFTENNIMHICALFYEKLPIRDIYCPYKERSCPV